MAWSRALRDVNEREIRTEGRVERRTKARMKKTKKG